MRAKGEAMIQQADRLLCESWNERMSSDGEPIDPSPTIDQAVNGGFPWLEILCALQDPERGRPCGNETPADHLRARSRQPAALPQVRQGGAASIRDSATIGLAAAPPSNRSLTDVQSLFDHDQPGRHQRGNGPPRRAAHPSYSLPTAGAEAEADARATAVVAVTAIVVAGPTII